MPKGLNSLSGVGVRFVDRAGVRSGRLVFTRCVGENAHRQKVWEAICDCGSVTQTARPHATKSCGCLQREVAASIQRAKALPVEQRCAAIAKNRKVQREKRRSDPLKAMQARLSRLHRHALKHVGALKTSRTFDHLGYTVTQFVNHIERQFLPGMGWHNMNEWQVDHILPISHAATEADIVALNQLSNLRPFWAKENNLKRNRRTVLL